MHPRSSQSAHKALLAALLLPLAVSALPARSCTTTSGKLQLSASTGTYLGPRAGTSPNSNAPGLTVLSGVTYSQASIFQYDNCADTLVCTSCGTPAVPVSLCEFWDLQPRTDYSATFTLTLSPSNSNPYCHTLSATNSGIFTLNSNHLGTNLFLDGGSDHQPSCKYYSDSSIHSLVVMADVNAPNSPPVSLSGCTLTWIPS